MSEPLGPPIRSYEDLHAAFRARAEQLDVSRETVDRIGGLTAGHASKLLAPRPLKRLGPTTLALMLGALGVQLRMEVDAEAMDRISGMFEKREPRRDLHAGTVQLVFSRRYLRRIAAKGGMNSRKNLTARQRRTLARKAAKARWAKKAA